MWNGQKRRIILFFLEKFNFLNKLNNDRKLCDFAVTKICEISETANKLLFCLQGNNVEFLVFQNQISE